MEITQTRRLIVRIPDRGSRERLKADLLKADPQARVTHDLPLIDAFSVEVTPAAAGLLQRSQAVPGARVVEDAEVTIPPEPPVDDRPHTGLDVATNTLHLEPLWADGITGKGVGIAIIDSGVVAHPDLKGRLIAFKDVAGHRDKPHDEVGHGTHVAGIAAGNGKGSHGQYVGVAPGADIIAVRVMNEEGHGSYSDIIAGIQWAVDNKERYHIRVMNLSLGSRTPDSAKDDPVVAAVEAAAAAGIVPCVAAGNAGPDAETIASPGNAPSAITVGAFDDKGTAGRSDDEIAKFSSRGPTRYDGLAKPDLVAPGVKIMAANAKGGYIEHSGTSMATPMVAGCVALLLQARPDLTPRQVKEALMRTAQPMPGLDGNAQGSGVVNPFGAIRGA